MPIKIFSAVVAIVLMLGFLAPVVLKLKDLSLGIVIVIGIAMMLIDLWQSLQSRDQ
jgi:hypothetical protein